MPQPFATANEAIPIAAAGNIKRITMVLSATIKRLFIQRRPLATLSGLRGDIISQIAIIPSTPKKITKRINAS